VSIDSRIFNNPILKRVAKGDLSVVNDINEDNANITEFIPYCGKFTPLLVAAEYGHIVIVKRLLAKNCNGSYEFPDVIQNIAAENNSGLLCAAQNGHIEVVKRILAKNHDGSYEFPEIIQDIAILDNNALILATERGHYEISYILATAQWPNGVKDIPQGLRWCVPAIRKGEIIVNKQEEALQESTQLFRWLQEGYIPTSRQDLYLPPRLSSKELQETTTLDFDVMNIVNKYAGTQRSIDTSRPTNAELNMVSIRSFNLLKSSSSIMISLERARVERESKENYCHEQALIPYSRLGLN
jgi:hypothetical protein